MDFAFPKPKSKAAENVTARKARDAHRRVIYRLVSKRDKVCRCCQARTNLHHHHLTYRSRGGDDEDTNLILLCHVCHDDIHAYRLSIVGTNANLTLRFVRAK